jgi:hypothetical protein
VTFGQPFAAVPRTLQLSASNAAAAALSGAGRPWADSLTATAWALNANTTALAAATAYTWYYQVIG